MPRQILARASLNATTLDEAISLLTASPRAGAFHHTLGQMGDSRLFSVEATGSGSSVRELTATFGHANHLIHPQLEGMEQIVTGSSGSRQQRLDAWLASEPVAWMGQQRKRCSPTSMIRCYRFTGYLPTIRTRKIRWRRPFLP